MKKSKIFATIIAIFMMVTATVFTGSCSVTVNVNSDSQESADNSEPSSAIDEPDLPEIVYEWESDEYIYFGSYPQSDVTEEKGAELNGYVEDKPTNNNDNGWTSYKYYKGNGNVGSQNNDEDYMWYKDVDIDSDGAYDYRAVYFTSYRPYATYNSTSNYQSNNGYNVNTIYWFEYEPIKWRVLENADGYATILSFLAIDSRDYNYTTESRTIDDKTIYANNYEYSSIREWLNGTFYDTAFNSLEKAIIQLVTVDNSEASANPDDIATQWNGGKNSYICDNTEDYVWLLSEQEVTKANWGFAGYNVKDAARQITISDYAKAQGCCDKNYCDWWLRSPSYYSAILAWFIYDSGIDGYGDYVSDTGYGVVPAIKIKL